MKEEKLDLEQIIEWHARIPFRRVCNTDIYLNKATVPYYDLHELFAYKFAFCSRQKEEQAKVLNFFGMETNKANLEMISSLVSGTCLFQDHFGENQRLATDILFESWLLTILSTHKQDQAAIEALALEEGTGE